MKDDDEKKRGRKDDESSTNKGLTEDVINHNLNEGCLRMLTTSMMTMIIRMKVKMMMTL